MIMKLSINKLKKYVCLSDQKSAFYDYQLTAFHKYIGLVAFVLGIFNIALLIPDLIFMNGMSKKLFIIIFRLVFSGMLFLLSYKFKKITKMIVLFEIGTVFELLSIVEFLFVLNLYYQPDFMIQAMGMLIINIAVFLFPNRCLNMFVVSILGTAGFLIYSFFVMKPLNLEEFWAGVVYLSLAIFLCSLFALEIDKHQYNEFIAKKELIHLSSTDQLTQAWNRNKLVNEFNELQKYYGEHNLPLTLALLDIDKFKVVNDQNGHCIADTVLVEMVKLINCNLRSTDILVRWGGDEFILLFPNTYLGDTTVILERIRTAIEEFIFTDSIKITCSFGAVEKKDSFDLDTMIRRADSLMYAAKDLGGNRVQYDN